MDIADRAAQDEEIYADARKRSITVYAGVSPELCDECCKAIEPARRKILPGTRVCAVCAHINDQIERHVARR